MRQCFSDDIEHIPRLRSAPETTQFQVVVISQFIPFRALQGASARYLDGIMVSCASAVDCDGLGGGQGCCHAVPRFLLSKREVGGEGEMREGDGNIDRYMDR